MHFTPQPIEVFNRRKRGLLAKWHLGETYIKICAEWPYRYQAIDNPGATVEFFFRRTRDVAAAKRFIRKALGRYQRRVQFSIDGSQPNRTAIFEADLVAKLKTSETDIACEPIQIRTSKYLNNSIEQDHRRIKRLVGPMLGFKSENGAGFILSGIKLVHLIRKRQLEPIDSGTLSFAGQFDSLAA
ncbi:IS6 family transposase [Asticcacaulis sp. W401b]|uniref:IS6 family transposase n=1 Tax=Asticcacaulis sp. W401b TaxID=3388666 RepID=UPI003970579D